MTRQRSRIRSKTRSDSSQKSEDEVTYCVCRSSDGTRFMIACDNCEEWYHGDCINVTPKQANNIKRFFCHICIGRNPSLEIEYKTSKENRSRFPNLRQQIKKINFSSDEENDADLSSSSSPDKLLASNNKRALRKRWQPPIFESVGKKRRGRPKERHDDYDEEATEDEIETSGFVPSMGGDCVEEVAESGYGGQLRLGGRAVSTRSPGGIGRPQLLSKVNHRSYMSQNYGNERRKFNTVINNDYGGVLEDSDYHRHNNMRRRNELQIGEIRQRLINPVTPNKNNCTVGSKMRRGDHLPGGGGGNSGLIHRRGLDSLEMVNDGGVPTCRYGRLEPNRGMSTNASLRRVRRESNVVAVGHISSNTSSVSGQYNDGEEGSDDEEEDVMVPGEVMSPSTWAPRRGADSRHYNQSPQQQRVARTTASNDKHPYMLGYPDHLYCKHHRSYDWHGGAYVSDALIPVTDSSTPSILRHTSMLSPPQVPSDTLVQSRDCDTHTLSPTDRFLGSRRLLAAPPRNLAAPGTPGASVPSTNISGSRRKAHSALSLVDGDDGGGSGDTGRVAHGDQHRQSWYHHHRAMDQSQSSTNDNAPISHIQPMVSSHTSTDSNNTHTRTLFMAHKHSQEFYVINDDQDDLEINWPKETVNV